MRLVLLPVRPIACSVFTYITVLVIILSVYSGMMKKKERLCPHFSVVYRPIKVEILTKTQNWVGLTVVNVRAVRK